jgi:hypothetical protein
MTMNYTPMDSSFQCASFESKKFYLAFFCSREDSQKEPKETHILAHFWLPHATNGVYATRIQFPYDLTVTTHAIQ